MNEKHERGLRRKAIRLTLRGLRPKDIRKQIPRSRRWLWKWQTRFQRLGWAGLHSQSRRPHHSLQRYSDQVRQMVASIRRQLEKCKVGLIGPHAIHREIECEHLLRRIPCESTLNTILHEERLIKPSHQVREAYYPQPTATERYVLQSMDWTCRYLEGGVKVYAFHSVDLQSRAIHQSIRTDKRTTTAWGHLLDVCQRLGIPAGLQLDNDAAFNGSRKKPRVFSPFVRLALYLGIELIFIPMGEAKRNGVVERINGLWSQSFWKRRHFRSLSHVQRTAPEFETWYVREYAISVGEKRTWPKPAVHRLTATQRRALPTVLPITVGRVHFVRLVDADGDITLLNETWHVNKRLAHHYVWATVVTDEQRLKIYHQRSDAQPLRLLKIYRYEIAEPIQRLRPEFQRPYRRRKMCTMSLHLSKLPKSKKRVRCR